MRIINTSVEYVSKVIDEFENEIELLEVIISRYNQSGRITQQKRFLDEDLEFLQSNRLYKYDNNGCLTETLTLDQNEEPTYKINYWKYYYSLLHIIKN